MAVGSADDATDISLAKPGGGRFFRKVARVVPVAF